MFYLSEKSAAMKKLFTTLFLACLFSVGYGQDDPICIIDFENLFDCDEDYYWIDYSSNPNNIWYETDCVAYSEFLSIGVCSTNTYPINDTSIFYFLHVTAEGWHPNCRDVEFGGYYYSDSDSLNDFGIIELSPNNGTDWINLLDDTLYNQYYTVEPADLNLTGNSNGWQSFYFELSGLGVPFVVGIADTVLFRFTFISDSIQNQGIGLAFDDIYIENFYCPSVPENELTHFFSSLFPNPANNSATIEFENPTNSHFSLQVFDITGRAVIEQTNIRGNRAQLNTQHLPSGIYQYRLLSEKERKQSFGKFVVE